MKTIAPEAVTARTFKDGRKKTPALRMLNRIRFRIAEAYRETIGDNATRKQIIGALDDLNPVHFAEMAAADGFKWPGYKH
jgi:hypothetical protein